MHPVWLVGLGGFLGAVARFWLSTAVQRLAPASFPAGTLVVNVLGCLVIGIVIALIEHHAAGALRWRAFLVLGVLGSFTTFSALGHETYELLRHGAPGLALLSAGGNLVLGLAAVWAGRAAAMALAA